MTGRYYFIVIFATLTACCFVDATMAQAPAVEEADKPAATGGEESSVDDPAVAAILATQPRTPSECLRAALTLVDLHQPAEAKKLLKQLLDTQPDAEQLADLGEKFGQRSFIDLAGNTALLPEAQKLADAVLPAIKARLEDPRRIAGLIEQLQDPQPDKRIQALAGLQQAQTAAIRPLVAVLADPARAAEHANVRTVLAGMGRPAGDALVALLDGADVPLIVQAVQTLAEMNQRKYAIYLLALSASDSQPVEVRSAAAATLRSLIGKAPRRSEAVRLLTEKAAAYFDRREMIDGDVAGTVDLWQWDVGKRQLVVKSISPEAASRVLAARLAREAFALAPDDRDVRLLYLTTALEAAAYANGLDKPLGPDDPVVVALKQFDVKSVEKVLEYAMAHKHPAAATATVRVLAEIGKADELLYQGAKPAPLVQAVQQADRRLRMAALEAVVALKPTRPYPGSSSIPPALGFFAASSGMRKALVGAPRVDQARDLANVLAAAGIQTDTATSGNEFFQLATGSPDYETAWLDVGILRPDVATLLQQLRRDPRTALLRVGLIAREGFNDLAEKLAEGDSMCMAFARPRDEQAMTWQLKQLESLGQSDFVDFEQRQHQAHRALQLLAELSRVRGGLYDLRRIEPDLLRALDTPTLAVEAAVVLAGLNSSGSQRALVDLASDDARPLETREAAAAAFRQNVQQHGILLTTEQIQEQYRRYNASEKLDRATQQLLGLILDCLEASIPQK